MINLLGADAEEQIEQIEEDDFPLESYDPSKDAQNELDSISAKRPRTFQFKNSDDFRLDIIQGKLWFI